MLAALVLALDDDARGQVREAHGRFDFVDVLAAVAAGAESVYAKVFGPDDDFDAVVNFRDDENGGKGRVAPRRLIERRYAHQTMHAAFARQQAVGVFAFDLHRGGLDARFLARSGIEHRGAKAFLLRPAEIHAQEHLGPVLGFCAARAGLDGDDGVEAVAFAGEKSFGFEVGDKFIGRVEFGGNIAEERIALGVVGLFLREMKIGFDVAGLAFECVEGAHAVLELLALLERGLGLLLILPEIGAAGYFFERGELFAGGGDVKDSSAQARCVSGARRSGFAGLRYVALAACFDFTHETRRWKMESGTLKIELI